MSGNNEALSREGDTHNSRPAEVRENSPNQEPEEHNADGTISDTPPTLDLERQPLLNDRERPRKFLSPDDARVSPLNLHKIRLLKSVLTVINAINGVMLFVCVLDDFISVPGFGIRGRSPLELDLILICIVTNLVTLWCFAVPAYYERVLGYICSALTGIDLFLVLIVGPMRKQFSLPGIIILVWTFGNILLNCFADYWVEKGRLHQEIKYTGRAETRRTISELFVMFVKIVMKFALFLIIWNISLFIWLQTFDTHEKPWGKLVPVDNDSYRVHLSCYGDVHKKLGEGNDSQPIVLIEGGQHTSSEEFQEWVEELYHLNKLDRYCIWDRPGYGFSDSAPSPISIGIVSEVLTEALLREKIEGPFAVVGFDIGGLYARMFASRNTGRVHSLLLVDSWHEDLLKQRPFSRPNFKNENKKVFRNILEFMDVKTGFKVWLKGLVSPLGIIPNVHWFFHPKRHSSNNRIFGSDMRYMPKYLRARLQEQVSSSILSYSEVVSSNIESVPVSIISSDNMIKRSLNWGKWQRELTRLSSKTTEWIVAENSDHFIWRSPRGREQLQSLLLRLIGAED